MKSTQSKQFFYSPLNLHQPWCRLIGFFLLGLTCFSPPSLATPDKASIAQQHQVLAPYQPQINKRLNSVSPLLNHIFTQLKQYQLPADFVLIPMLESSYNPKAVSSANAAGLWQLIPATAIRFGLQVSDNEDQRFDSKASTQAALAYLAFLYKKFDKDIALTLAAYNAGEGRVARAIRKAGSPDFKALTLPKETHQYVSRFYALQQLIDTQALNPNLFQPFMLFSSQRNIIEQPLIDFTPLPSLISL
ncbi:lytic transglycosylase domain-containing protein [Vibrio sp. nBUS_14]|uniref:lytic transglycosylase domain-containing protein n=1 Tax=unclassified Vibrio TaxID=2614977 RepID=UPI003EBEC7F8